MDADAIVVGGGLAGLVAATELIEAGKRIILLDQEPAQSLGGQAFWSFGGLFFVDSPEQRRMRIRDSHDLALQDWLGSAGFDREEDLLAAQVGRGLRCLRCRREARLAPRQGPQVVSHRRLGRARRLSRHRARQLGAALPRDLGHRARHRQTVRGPPARGREAWARLAALPPSRQRLHHHGGRGRRRARRHPGGERRRARLRQLAQRRRRLRAEGTGHRRHVRRHRRQPRSRAQGLAEAAGRAASRDDLRRARSRRRSHARYHGGRRRQRHQPRPHVALHGGHPELEPDLVATRHPHLARTVLAVARRARATAARAAVPRLRHAGHARPHHGKRLRILLVRAEPEDHRARVRAVRLRAEPGPHQRQLGQGDPRAQRRRRAGTGARLHGEGRRLHRRAQPDRSGRGA